jgi:Flp pilus assembly protein TadG
MKRKTNFTRDQTGDGYIDIAIVIIIVFLLLASLLGLFPVLSAQQSLNGTARQLARSIEITGSAGTDLEQTIQEIGGITAADVDVDTVWHDPADKTIQLKTPFKVTVTKNVPITIFRPSFGDPIVINIEITATADGISEVYFK